MKLSRELSERLFEIRSDEELQDWLRAADKEAHGLRWVPLGGIENNVHTVEVASDPALALVERVTNSIDGLLDLRARERAETSATPHEGARRWWGVPPDGLSSMTEEDRRKLADMIRVTMHESGTVDRPTIVIQDHGTGQHPEDFPDTILSLLKSNKKTKTHQMGVYNAGGAASCKFGKGTIVVARLAPSLADGRPDEVGAAVIRYSDLDPDKFKTGVYEYCIGKDGSVLRLDVSELPDMPWGAYVRLVEYHLHRHARGAHEAKHSLWHLFHAALPDPALPVRIIETRAERFPAMKGRVERRVVPGLLHELSTGDRSVYSDVRSVAIGPPAGKIVLRYFVLNEKTDPDAYTTSDQAVTIMLDGQRRITRDRYWLKRNLGLNFLYRRVVVIVDGTGLASAMKRDVFTATRETGVDHPHTKRILDLVVQELKEDEELANLDELAKQQTLAEATKTTTEKVKRALASQIGAFLKGDLEGRKGGGRGTDRPKPRKRGRPTPPNTDDSQMLEIPDRLVILSDPVRIERGSTASLRMEINAKNGFLPKYADGLSVVFGPEVKDHLKVLSVGKLLGGRVRVTLEALDSAPIGPTGFKVALVVTNLGVLLTADGRIEVAEPRKPEKEDGKHGGEPDVDIIWVGRDKWESFSPPWDAETAGECNIYREDPTHPTAITRAEWILNEAFSAYEKVIEEKRLNEDAQRSFQDRYAMPLAFGLFRQRLAEEAKEEEADEQGAQIEIPDDYVRGERARMARAVVMALDPELRLEPVGA
jgi:hypothetical protein